MPTRSWCSTMDGSPNAERTTRCLRRTGSTPTYGTARRPSGSKRKPPRRRNNLAALQSAQRIAFGAEVQPSIIDARRVGEDQIVIFHLLRPPIAGAMVALALRAGSHVGEIGVAVARLVPALHREIVIAHD